MQGKHSFLALSTAFAALFVGCEWTGTSESDSWSSAYDAMNFSGTYRAVTRQTSANLDDQNDDNEDNQNKEGFASYAGENGGTFFKGEKGCAGQTEQPNIVPNSLQIVAQHGNTVYVWNDNGSGSLIFGGVSGNTGGSSTTTPVPNEEHGTTSTSASYSFKLNNANVVPGSVIVRLGGEEAFTDNGDGTLKANGFSGGGQVIYTTGSVVLTFKAPPTAIGKGGKTIFVDYTSSSSDVTTSNYSGGGAIQYASGGWSLTLSPEMPENATVKVSYSAYKTNTEKEIKKPAVTGNTGTDVTALTVSQNGQNLTITLNNGVVMTGKFTNVQQTGKVNQDTNAGYNTYNAQFQVQTTDSKMVGSLNYDLQNGYRMLNGTWVWGKNSYDVQAAGPAWLNSADQSTLSPGVITK